MGKIAKMTPHLANMIAAGEVVEKPSSVVKELVENAIDAHAKNISVFLLEGGLKEIKVVDDGDGMDADDVHLAFHPHATSKIKTEYDLSRILSLGFRGEAIASIAAVSQMQIISSQDGKEGYQVTYEAGTMRSSSVTSANRGTAVIVKNLFFNTPARLKYLKSAKNEFASVMFFMEKISLAHPEIRFTIYNDDKCHLKTTGSLALPALMGEIYGIEVAKAILETEFVIDGVQGKLLLIKPEIYRSNKLEISLIVNGRYVKNYKISNAIIEGYKTYLPIGKYPITVVYLEIDPMLVDVNIHPSKTEIKISNEKAILETLIGEVRASLEKATLIPTRVLPVQNQNVGYEKMNIFELPKPVFKENEILYSTEPVREESKFDVPKETMESVSMEENFVEKEELSKLPYMEYVGQAFGTYLIFQNDQGLFLMDQHAAAERINYEKNYLLLGNPQQPTTELLVPILLNFTKSEALFLEEHFDEFFKLGFEIDAISTQDFIVRRIPLWAKTEQKEVIQDIFSMLILHRKVDVISFRDEIAKQMSCKGSIKANHALRREEIDALVENLSQCKNPFTCPHGRPTIIKFTQEELEKMFERIQS